LSSLRCLHILNVPGFTISQPLPHLEQLQLPRVATLPEAISSMTRLTSLTAMVQIVPDSISTLRALHKLDLSNSTNLATLPDALSHLEVLEELVMDECTSLIALPAAVCKMHSLRVLSIMCKRFLELPEGISGLVKLCELHLGATGCLQSLPPSCSRLVCLQRLSLCNIKGLQACPEVVGQLLGLTLLDLSFNKFTQLPESLGNLSRLMTLNVLGDPRVQRNVLGNPRVQRNALGNPRVQRNVLGNQPMFLCSCPPIFIWSCTCMFLCSCPCLFLCGCPCMKLCESVICMG
jgi:Leucine-rich repeat (LRR) protein